MSHGSKKVGRVKILREPLVKSPVLGPAIVEALRWWIWCCQRARERRVTVAIRNLAHSGNEREHPPQIAQHISIPAVDFGYIHTGQLPVMEGI